jgi:hypothetical protein
LTSIIYSGKIATIQERNVVMVLPDKYPARIWVCPGCKKPFSQRWLLSRHLKSVHRLRKNAADEVAIDAEYVLTPRYMKRSQDLHINPDDYYSEDEL